MSPIARGLAGPHHVVEPFQRGSGGERLTIARHVADLHEIVTIYGPRSHPALIGASWGAMLALAYAAAHPDSTGPLILIGCGTFDVKARAELERTIAERMTEGIRARLKCADYFDQDQRLKASAEAMLPVYACDLLASPHEDDHVDARAHQETWDDMLRMQAEGVYPAAFAAIKAPALMIHGSYDPLPGRLIFEGLRPHLPQLEYRELERCGHYPWLERATADLFFSIVREWLARHSDCQHAIEVRDGS